jgi:hypothetical protein
MHLTDPVPPITKRGQRTGIQGLDARFVTVTSDDGELQIVCRLGPEGAQVTAGGGYQLIPRQGRRPLVHWSGSEAPTMTLDLMIDRLMAGKSVEDDVRVVEQMAGALVAGDTEPPPLIVAGAAVPHSVEKSSSARWVIAEPPDWGERRHRYDGQRIRQQVTLTLYLLTEGEQLKQADAPDAPPDYRVVQSKADDTFASVAARELKNKKLGTKLAQLNRDFHSAFKHATATTRTGGLTVRLPTSATKKLWEQALKGKG